MDTSEGILNLFTLNHAIHDNRWLFSGSKSLQVCLACLVETLEDSQTLAVRRKKVLSELLGLLSRDSEVTGILFENPKVAFHLSEIILGLLEDENEVVVKLAIETTVLLICKLQNETIAREAIDRIEKNVLQSQNMRKCCAYLILLGRLLEMLTPLAEEIATQKINLWQFCLSNLSYPDENVRMTLLFITLSICKNGELLSSLKAEDKEKIFINSCECLVSSKGKEVLMNALGVMKCFSQSKEAGAKLILNLHDRDATNVILLSDALKKVLLHRELNVQIGAIQCMTELIKQENTLIKLFLNRGIAEFIFEGLESSSDIVLASLFCCLTELCKSKEFHEGSYSIYGLESIISALNKALSSKNPETIKQGLHVLNLITVREPQSVPLFTNGSIFERCLNVIEESFKAMEYKVLLEGTYLVQNLLHHVPANVPLGRVTNLFCVAVMVMKRFTTKTVTSFKCMKSEVAQDLLYAQLKMLQRALDFSEEYKIRTPSHIEAILGDSNITSSQVSSKEVAIQEFDNLLSRVVDEIAITAVMVNFEVITDPSLFKTFFSILNTQLSENSMACAALARKLLNASFVRLTMEVNKRFSECRDGLGKVLKGFLKNLCISLEKDDTNSCLGEVFDRAPIIPSTVEEIKALLSQSSLSIDASRVADAKLLDIQCVCIDLLNVSSTLDEQLIPEDSMLLILHKFITLHRNLETLPLHSFKNLLFIYIRCLGSQKLQGGPLEMPSIAESQRIIEDYLLNLHQEKLVQLIIPSSSFIAWIFSSASLGEKFGNVVLEMWLSHTEMQGKEAGVDLRFLVENPVAIRSLLALLTSENTAIICQVLSIVERLLSEDTNNARIGSVLLVISESLHKLFLSNNISTLPDHVLIGMLSILCTMAIQCNSTTEVKLVYHVVNILISSNKKAPEVSITGINYMNLLLIQDLEHLELNIAAMLLSKKPFMEWLQRGCEVLPSLQIHVECTTSHIRMLSAVIVLAGNLVRSQIKFKIPVNYRLVLRKGYLIELLNEHRNQVLRLSAILFWEAILEAPGCDTCIAWTRDFESNKDTSKELAEEDLEVILVYLQNSLIHECDAIQMSGMRCLNAMVSHVMDPALFVSNQWNVVILESLLFSAMSDKVTATLVHFCTTLMKFSKMEESSPNKLLQSSIKFISHQVANATISDHVTIDHCILFLKELPTQDVVDLPSSLRANLCAWLREVKDRVAKETQKERTAKFENTAKLGRVVIAGCGTNGVRIDEEVVSDVLRKFESLDANPL